MSARRRDLAQWRSRESREGAPEVRHHYEREFPEGASELPEGISRRSMVQLLGASISLAGATACRRPVERIVPFVDPPERLVPGVAQHYATTMPFGTSALGVLVESHEGRPTKIEGNELHPSSLGGTSTWMQASILDLYDPDRSRSVLEKGEPRTFDDFARAWTRLEGGLASSGGAGLGVLLSPYSSPTLARLAAAGRERWPNARWVVWDPISDENAELGLERATGTAVRALYAFDRAKVILAVDSDFLATESESPLNVRRFAAGRRVSGATGEMSRLWAVEGVHSLTGANADHRFPLRSADVAPFVVRLARALASRGLPVEVPDVPELEIEGVEERWLGALADDLASHAGESVIVAGRRQPPAVHAAVCALNAALGNLGTTVELREGRDAAGSRSADLADLVDGMRGGSVETLVVLGSNPAYAAPADLGFADALQQVETVIHLGTHRDETGELAHWHIPQAHYLEAWGDARSADGTASVIQPLIEPLFGGKSTVEVLGLIATGLATPGSELVRETWGGLLGGEGEPMSESRWRRVLHDGLLAESASAPASVDVDADVIGVLTALVAVASGVGAVPTDLEIVFQASPAVFDGRFANNGWLQELPDPLTKLTWDNAALLSPATAAALGVGNEEVVRVRRGERELELPVWTVPGQADGTVVVWLGYGRRAGGRIAVGLGGNGYGLRTSDASDFAGGVSLEPTGRRHDIAQTQDHHGMEGRPIVREASVAEFRREPDFAKEMGAEVPVDRSMWKDWTFDEGHQWGMTIDLNTCVGCNACVTACQSENNVPIVGREQVRNGREMHWLRVDRYFAGDEGAPETVFQPVPCMQCETAPCEQVCPVAATVHDREGLNVMVYNRCIGTRYCSNNCPYKVRRFNFFNYTNRTPQTLRLAANPDVTVRSRGVMEKCSYCVQRINRARIDAKVADRPLRDGDIRTACQQACPASAIEFGDLRDPESRVVAAKGDPRNYSLLEELMTRPRTTFLAKLRNPHPELPDLEEEA